MDLYKYLCFILLTTVCYIDADIEITKELYTWAEATQVCTLATPNLTFSESGITPEVANLSAEAWLGYTEKMTQFEYFGCAKKSELNPYVTANYKTGDPGKCWSACNNVTAIAVNGNECYCLHNVNFTGIELKKDKCNKKCPGQPKIVCGGGNEHVSLYKTTYTEPFMENYQESYICLWYDSNMTSFFWGNCTKHNLMICYYGNNTWVYNGTNKINEWITMTTKCFKDGNTQGIPSNYNQTEALNTTSRAKMWTGIIRNGVIYPTKNPTHTFVGKYGFVRNGTLSFTNNVTMTKKALCVKGTVTVETATSTGKTTTSTGKTTTSTGKTTTSTGKTTTSIAETTPSTGKTTTSTVKQTSSGSSDNSNEQTDTSSHATDSHSKGSSDVGAIVGATVAIIIVIIVVIVLVVLWKRGIKLPLKKARKSEKEKTQATNMTYSFSRPDNTIQSTDESSFTNYAEVDVSKMTLVGEVKQNRDTNRTSCSSDEPHTYFVLEKVDQGPYDTTKTTRQIHDQHTFNPYNKISLEESSNYDHIGANVNDSKTLGLDNPYNTTTLVNSNKNNGFTNNAFNRNYESDDTYNHIDNQSRHTERNHSNNPYNTTALGHSKNDHGVINIAFNINDECDDTYNHIGDQSGQNDQTITANPYNTTTLGNSQTNGVNNSTFNNNDNSEDTYNHINGKIPITRPTFTDNDYATLK